MVKPGLYHMKDAKQLRTFPEKYIIMAANLNHDKFISWQSNRQIGNWFLLVDMPRAKFFVEQTPTSFEIWQNGVYKTIRKAYIRTIHYRVAQLPSVSSIS